MGGSLTQKGKYANGQGEGGQSILGRLGKTQNTALFGGIALLSYLSNFFSFLFFSPKAGFFCIVLAVFLVDQASLELNALHVPLPSRVLGL